MIRSNPAGNASPDGDGGMGWCATNLQSVVGPSGRLAASEPPHQSPYTGKQGFLFTGSPGCNIRTSVCRRLQPKGLNSFQVTCRLKSPPGVFSYMLEKNVVYHNW